MSLEVIAAGATCAGILYVWVWRRYRYMRAHFTYHRKMKEFERMLRDARDEMSEQSPVRVARDSDGELVALLAAAGNDERALAAGGFTVLGDVVFEPAGKPARAVLRALVDASGTTCALLGIYRKYPTLAKLWVVSYRGDEARVTRRAPWPSLAEPPFVHVKLVPAQTAPAELVARHREHAGGDLLRIASLDELVAQLTRIRGRTVEWRAAQPPDELLDADLRGVLGASYAKHGKTWARRLRGELPQATLRAP